LLNKVEYLGGLLGLPPQVEGDVLLRQGGSHVPGQLRRGRVSGNPDELGASNHRGVDILAQLCPCALQCEKGKANLISFPCPLALQPKGELLAAEELPDLALTNLFAVLCGLHYERPALQKGDSILGGRDVLCDLDIP